MMTESRFMLMMGDEERFRKVLAEVANDLSSGAISSDDFNMRFWEDCIVGHVSRRTGESVELRGARWDLAFCAGYPFGYFVTRRQAAWAIKRYLDGKDPWRVSIFRLISDAVMPVSHLTSARRAGSEKI